MIYYPCMLLLVLKFAWLEILGVICRVFLVWSLKDISQSYILSKYSLPLETSELIIYLLVGYGVYGLINSILRYISI